MTQRLNTVLGGDLTHAGGTTFVSPAKIRRGKPDAGYASTPAARRAEARCMVKPARTRAAIAPPHHVLHEEAAAVAGKEPAD